MNIKNTSLFATVAFAGLISACAHTASPQLIEARSAYTASNSGLAGKLAPTELYDAWTVLSKANKEFDDVP